MKITTKKSTEVPLKTPTDFARAIANTAFQTSIATVTTSSDLATLIRALNGKTRPFAVGIVEAEAKQ